MELTIAMINGLDKSLWRHISILSTPLLPPSFDLGFEFVLRDVHATAEVAVDIICFKNNPGQGEDRRGKRFSFVSLRQNINNFISPYIIFRKAKRVLTS